jgi:hypothetical protein
MAASITTQHVDYIKTLAPLGRLTPAELVADAHRPKSPLHDLFDWDVKRAASAHWLERGREIIRAVTVIVTTERTTVRVPAYVRDPTVPPQDQGYVSVLTLRQDPEQARAALLVECQRAAATLKRARSIAAALNLSEEIDGVLEQLTGFRLKVEQREAA